jgi:hypothetical protein
MQLIKRSKIKYAEDDYKMHVRKQFLFVHFSNFPPKLIVSFLLLTMNTDFGG